MGVSPDISVIIYIIFFFVLGAVTGSFVTAITHRIKNDQSWIVNDKNLAARSACPKCGTVLKVANLIPVLSWLWQRGRCAACDAPISGHYIIIEILCAFSMVGLYFTLGLTPHLLFAVLLFPFALSQAVLFCQNKIVSKQLLGICFVILILYLGCFSVFLR